MLHITVITPLQRTNATGIKIIDALRFRRNMFEQVIDALRLRRNMFEQVIDALRFRQNMIK